MDDRDDSPTLGRLVEQLSEQTTRLVRAEIALAKAEMSAKAKASGIGVGLIACAGVIVAYAIGVLIWSAVLGLGEAWPLWLSALVISVVMLLAAGGLVAGGVRLLQRAAKRPESIDRVRSDIDTVRSHLATASHKEDQP
ncbi:phage holin family protein [Xylanimonas ulmi]|uniref:Putative superfamily III holin-X n=1 Tax=Xylanimonas ulmi TaxID=228973 RepID=A0A4Q7M6S0_9MICO|nr:phage holin family protein [Xylanibacterium ulmi]RZS62308.1 putative superfamily III holin-X [Xylanibacterium ulmi]